MKTKSTAFQLEETVPGTFFFQGLSGGMLGGFIYIVSAALWAPAPQTGWVIPLTPVFMLMGGLVGVVKGTLIWGTYRLTGIRIRTWARVAATIVCIGLFASYVGLKHEIADWWQFTIGVGIAVLTALPTPFLVGSRVKPWELFTFGSIAVNDNQRCGSKSILATAGTVPLRFMSIVALGLWILSFACMREVEGEIIALAIIFSIPLIYLLLSAYLTFRSPRKVILLPIGVGLNLSVLLYMYSIYPLAYWFEVVPFVSSTLCTAFVVAWLVFLVARLSIRTSKVENPLSILTDAPVTTLAGAPIQREEAHHYCLGSRFLEWQERVA